MKIRLSLAYGLILVGTVLPIGAFANPEPIGFISPNEIFDQFLQPYQFQFSTVLGMGGHLDKSPYGSYQYRSIDPNCFGQWLTLESLSESRVIPDSQETEYLDTLHIGCQLRKSIQLRRRGPAIQPIDPEALLQFRWPRLSSSHWTWLQFGPLTIDFKNQPEQESWNFKIQVEHASEIVGQNVFISLAKQKNDNEFNYTLTTLTSVSNVKKIYKMVSTPDTVDPDRYVQKFFDSEGRISRNSFLSTMNQVFRDQSNNYLFVPIQ